MMVSPSWVAMTHKMMPAPCNNGATMGQSKTCEMLTYKAKVMLKM
jgi:hypothetical protein